MDLKPLLLLALFVLGTTIVSGGDLERSGSGGSSRDSESSSSDGSEKSYLPGTEGSSIGEIMQKIIDYLHYLMAELKQGLSSAGLKQ